MVKRLQGVLSLLMFLALAGAAAAQPKAGQEAILAGDKRVLLRTFAVDTCFRDLVFGSNPGVKVAATGAVRTNTPDKYVLEEQVAGLAWVRSGLATRRPDMVRTGWQVFDWGIERQKPDGGFETTDAVHQTTRFLEALAFSLLIDQANASSGRIKALKAGLEWLNQPERVAHAEKNSVTFTHRAWMRASLFQMASILLNDPDLAKTAARNARQAIAQQDQNGVFRERNGQDVGYHTFGMLFQQRWLLLSGSFQSDPAARQSFLKALQWLSDQVDPTGTIDRSNATRMGKEGHGNARKDVNYARTIEVALGAALMTEDARWVNLAAALDRGAQAEQKQTSRQTIPFSDASTGKASPAVVSACTLIN